MAAFAQGSPLNSLKLSIEPLFNDMSMPWCECAERTLSEILKQQLAVPKHVLAMLVNEYVYHREEPYMAYPIESFLSPDLIEKLYCGAPIFFNPKQDLIGIPKSLARHMIEMSDGKGVLEYPTKGFGKLWVKLNQIRLQKLADDICEPLPRFLDRVFKTQDIDEHFLKYLERLVGRVFERTKENPYSYLHTLNAEEVQKLVVTKYRSHFVELIKHHAMDFKEEELFQCLFVVIEHVYVLNDHRNFWKRHEAPDGHRRRPFDCVGTTLRVLRGKLNEELLQNVTIGKNGVLSTQGQIFELIPKAFAKVEWIEWREKEKSGGQPPYWFRRAMWGNEKNIQGIEETDTYQIRKLGTINEIERELAEKYTSALKFSHSNPTQQNGDAIWKATATHNGTMADNELRKAIKNRATELPGGKQWPHPGLLIMKTIKSQYMNVTEVAHKISVSQPLLQLVVTGKRNLNMDLASKFSAHFSEWTEDDLLWVQMKFDQYKYHSKKQQAAKDRQSTQPISEHNSRCVS